MNLPIFVLPAMNSMRKAFVSVSVSDCNLFIYTCTSRDSSLTTLAILNSAKKAFERNQQLKSVPNSPLAKLRRRQSVAIENARKNSLLSDPEDSSPSETEKVRLILCLRCRTLFFQRLDTGKVMGYSLLKVM